MQPLGILVFASVMATLGLQIILESVRTLIHTDNNFHLTRDQECWVMGIMLSVDFGEIHADDLLSLFH